jgi:hypothetical protein
MTTLTTEQQETLDEMKDEIFTYLNELRESGVTSMFGAVPYLMDEFSFDMADSRVYLAQWMKSYT